MSIGDTVRITRGGWSGFTGEITARFTGGWIAVRIKGWERTFAESDAEVVELDDDGQVIA